MPMSIFGCCTDTLFPLSTKFTIPLEIRCFNKTMPRFIRLAGHVMKFFENHINLLTHPPYPPDLNPIERAWVLLKRQLLIDYPDIGDTPGGPPAVKARLAQVLPRVWDNIPQKHFEALWKSMPARVEAVIDAKGWYTQY